SLLNTRLYPYQEQGALHLAFGGRTLLADDMGLGKCVGPDTPVFVNGKLMRAEDIWRQYAGAVTPDIEGEWSEPTTILQTNALVADGERIMSAGIARLYRQHIHEAVRRIRLEDGSQIILTRRHKLLGRFGWENQLQVGDYVSVPSRLQWDGDEVDPDLVTLLAWQVAEGYELTNRATVRIYQKNRACLENLLTVVQRVGEKFGLTLNRPKIREQKDRVPQLTIDSRAYWRFLQSMGYVWGKKSAEKRIPDFIVAGNLGVVRVFLREYFTAEGSVSVGMRSVEISSASAWLMQQLACMLRRFGIWLRIAEKRKCATNGARIQRTYYSGILGGHAARLFQREIGFSDSLKQAKLEDICAPRCNTNVEGIPAADLLTEMQVATQLPRRHFGVKPVYFDGTQNLSRQSAAQVLNALDNILSGRAETEYRGNPRSKWTEQTLTAYAALDRTQLTLFRSRLDQLVEREAFYCRIAEIREFDYEGWVYDFQVEEHHSFVAGNMLCHNTVQAIAACALLQQLRDIHKVLVITPASLKHQWAREIRRFTALSATVVQGGLKQRRDIYTSDAFFTLVNYELVRRDLEELERMRPDVIILDEAQRIKNWRTKTADAVKRLRSRYAFVLTGTPLENRLDELYSVFQFLDPRILGPLWHFNDRFYDLETRDDGSYKVIGYKNLDELRHTIAPYVVRRTRDEVLRDLPPRVDNNFFVEMTPQQTHAYDEFKEIVARLLAKSKRRPLTPKEHDLLLKALIKMRLICNALALHDKEIAPADREKTAPKLRELNHILDEQIASNGHKAIVFSQWELMLDFAKPILDRLNLGHVKLAGSVPTSQRGEIVDRFLNEADCRVFLSTDAGGVGLNLQAADLVINLDLPWNPAVLEQRIGRAHRHGQLNPVHVVNLIAQGTIEERMLDTLAAKRNVFGSVFGNEDSPTAISFRDSGQGLLRRLDAMLGAEIKPVVELEPVVETAVAPKPTLRAFADLLVARFPGRILLVRKAPVPDAGASVGYGVFIVVDRDPAELRAKIEPLASEYFTDPSTSSGAPALHLMEQESYRAFVALAGKTIERAAPEDEAYRALALPAPADALAELEKRLQKAREGFEFAAKRAQLADVVLRGGFPEEALRPLRDALGWALSSHLALVSDRDPSAEFPAARVIQAELVEAGNLSDTLAARCAQARELTEPPAEGAPPLSATSAEQLLAIARETIEAGQKRVAEKGL
ncbi:MAG: hypothetical protein KGJ80_07565, partial [Chloroflexota bacterium]|nr:hypothetical protein [Chloroflexota bacterium]